MWKTIKNTLPGLTTSTITTTATAPSSYIPIHYGSGIPITYSSSGLIPRTSTLVATDPAPAEAEIANTLYYMSENLKQKDFENLKKWFGILKENMQQLEVENIY